LTEAKYIASIADVKYLKDLPEEFIPYVTFKAAKEGRVLEGGEKVAILNVSTTTSYIAIFLDPRKKIEEIEKEVWESSATLNTDSKKILKDLLKEG
jgi:hypothetical protein